MTPAQAIAQLDRKLAGIGEDIVLIRGQGPTAARVTCRAKVSGFQNDELVGDLAQQDSLVIMSPTQIVAAGWPGAGLGVSTPIKGDRLRIQGFAKIVIGAAAVQLAGRTVRIEIRVRGEAS